MMHLVNVRFTRGLCTSQMGHMIWEEVAPARQLIFDGIHSGSWLTKGWSAEFESRKSKTIFLTLGLARQ